jgi:hypothetical protein
MPATTLRILARNFESDGFKRDRSELTLASTLHFSEFSVEYLHQGNSRRLRYARQFFRDAMFDECLIEREYREVPPLPRDPTGFGAITNEPEDLLLLLRLFQPGDLAFVAVTIQDAKGTINALYPNRVISNLVTESTRQFAFRKDEIGKWESFAQSLRKSPSWNADWLSVARRSFIYGMSKEFNPNFESEVDRVVDYMTALEATLVPETDFVKRRLKNRAIKLLGLDSEEAGSARKLLNDMYSIRSTLVHGSSLGSQLDILQDRDRWQEFECLVRRLLVAGLKEIPAEDSSRRSFLSGLYDPNDKERAEELIKNYKAIGDNSVRRDLVVSLNNI